MMILLLLWRKQETAYGPRNEFIENTRDYNTRNDSEVNRSVLWNTVMLRDRWVRWQTGDKMQIKLCNYERNV